MRIIKQLIRRKNLKEIKNETSELDKVLSTLDLIGLGVGCTLGVGVYVLPGMVAKELAGPGVILSFFIAAITSVFAGLCFAEFGARVPRAGSVYIYSYVTIGEFIAFIIGWSLIMEYIIGTASVARGLSVYLDTIAGNPMESFYRSLYEFKNPTFISEYFDVFAFSISILVTISLALGVKESLTINNVLSFVNVSMVVFVILVGSSKANFSNWNLKETSVPPWGGEGGFFPFGIMGAIKGAATCFYGYIGFDVIATSAEEVENPQKSVPISIIVALVIVFFAYSGLSAILTLMCPYYLQDVDAPIPFVFHETGLPWAAWFVAVGGIFGLLASLYSGMFPLPRVIYSMANDGLLFECLGKVHEKFKTPFTGTLISGFITALMASFFSLKHLVELLSLVTLLAYTIVSACVLLLRYRPDDSLDVEQDVLERRHLLSEKIRVSFIEYLKQSYSCKSVVPTSITSFIVTLNTVILCGLSIPLSYIFVYKNEALIQMETWLLVICSTIIILMTFSFFCVFSQPSNSTSQLPFRVPFVPFLPVLSIFVNIYLMVSLDSSTWLQFIVWILVGVVIYFGYSISHSHLRSSPQPIEYDVIRSDDEVHLSS